MRINDSRNAALVHAANCITVRSDLLHMVEILKIAYGTSWKSRKTSWKKKGQEVQLYMFKIC
jgi:hypothetical protein